MFSVLWVGIILACIFVKTHRTLTKNGYILLLVNHTPQSWFFFFKLKRKHYLLNKNTPVTWAAVIGLLAAFSRSTVCTVLRWPGAFLWPGDSIKDTRQEARGGIEKSGQRNSASVYSSRGHALLPRCQLESCEEFPLRSSQLDPLKSLFLGTRLIKPRTQGESLPPLLALKYDVQLCPLPVHL